MNKKIHGEAVQGSVFDFNFKENHGTIETEFGLVYFSGSDYCCWKEIGDKIIMTDKAAKGDKVIFFLEKTGDKLIAKCFIYRK